MIYKNSLELQARYCGAKVISAVYHGAHLVWEAVSSCFGSGHWMKYKPWRNYDAWRNY